MSDRAQNLQVCSPFIVLEAAKYESQIQHQLGDMKVQSFSKSRRTKGFNKCSVDHGALAILKFALKR